VFDRRRRCLHRTGGGQLAARDRVSQIFLQLPRGPGDLSPDRASAVLLQQARRRHFGFEKSFVSEGMRPVNT